MVQLGYLYEVLRITIFTISDCCQLLDIAMSYCPSQPTTATVIGMYPVHPKRVENEGVSAACRLTLTQHTRVTNLTHSPTNKSGRRAPCRPACVYICTEYRILAREHYRGNIPVMRRSLLTAGNGERGGWHRPPLAKAQRWQLENVLTARPSHSTFGKDTE